MKNKEKQTKNTVKGNKRPLFGVKNVVDNDGSLSCFWYKDKLYDLNYNEFADCKKVKTEEEGKAVNGFVRRGKYIHKDGNVVGKIKTDYSDSDTFCVAYSFRRCACDRNENQKGAFDGRNHRGR